ncbi:MAG: hypothetical protein LUG12_03670 [Erysipelotrichaceae bacterium]|nr:hypothetical protein [Erysipelotrichaceae bacterium]
MTFKIKLILFAIGFSLFSMFGFHFICQSHMKNIYACQVGIYSVEENKDAKVSQLSSSGYETYTYIKENQYYVLSMISEDLSEIEKKC